LLAIYRRNITQLFVFKVTGRANENNGIALIVKVEKCVNN